jgi:hypothetical protein
MDDDDVGEPQIDEVGRPPSKSNMDELNAAKDDGGGDDMRGFTDISGAHPTRDGEDDEVEICDCL